MHIFKHFFSGSCWVLVPFLQVNTDYITQTGVGSSQIYTNTPMLRITSRWWLIQTAIRVQISVESGSLRLHNKNDDYSRIPNVLQQSIRTKSTWTKNVWGLWLLKFFIRPKQSTPKILKFNKKTWTIIQKDVFFNTSWWEQVFTNFEHGSLEEI